MKTSQIINQVVRAVAHLHLGPKVCHRDIKPENFDLHETPDNATVKLTNFQLALIQEEPEALCHQVCGSVPFVAPEVLMGAGYSGMSADIWSTGVTVIEILCGSRTVEQAIGLIETETPSGKAAGYSRPDDSLPVKLKGGFQKAGSAGRLLQTHCLRDLESFLPTVRPMVDSMLKVEPEERWTASDLQSATETIPTKGPLAHSAPLPPLPQRHMPSASAGSDKHDEDRNQQGQTSREEHADNEKNTEGAPDRGNDTAMEAVVDICEDNGDELEGPAPHKGSD